MATESHLLKIANCDRADRKGDVVFIHGLDGDALATWDNAPKKFFLPMPFFRKSSAVSGGFWPAWLAETMPELGVWSLAYPAASSAWRGTAMALPHRAKNILEIVRLNDLGQRPLVFIVHSLGGLLIKSILRTATSEENVAWRGIAASTRGVLFLATPHGGSFLASIHNVFRVVARSNATIQDLQRESPYLEELNDWFRSNFEHLGIKAHVLREGMETYGVMVVDRLSANPWISSVPVIDTDCNHISICKPANREALVFKTAVDFIEGCFAAQLFAPRESVIIRLDRLETLIRTDSGFVTSGSKVRSKNGLEYHPNGVLLDFSLVNRKNSPVTISSIALDVLEYSATLDPNLVAMQVFHQDTNLELPHTDVQAEFRLDGTTTRGRSVSVLRKPLLLQSGGQHENTHSISALVRAGEIGTWRLRVSCKVRELLADNAPEVILESVDFGIVRNR